VIETVAGRYVVGGEGAFLEDFETEESTSNAPSERRRPNVFGFDSNVCPSMTT
jgi:hypothetical protein